ncbi:MAG TPA: preprotein translocase subunit SecE [bacterium]|nr:preprotein translocase subunit SecE [bacterium]
MFQNLKVFFSEARSEFNKISWPGWDEIKGSTAVVCITIVFLMVVLFTYDSVLAPAVAFVVKQH